MKLLAIATLFTFAILGYAAGIEQDVSTVFRMSSTKKKDLRLKLQAAGGCNANVCFAIDGSGSISAKEFLNEKNFVLDVVSVIAVDQPVELAAVQYARGIRPISPLTVDDRAFVLLVNGTQQLRGSSRVVGGLKYCISQLRRRPGEANKLVLLGDGRSRIGSRAIRKARGFRRTGGDVCAVAAGFPNKRKLLKIVGRDRNRLFEVDNFLDVLALQRLVEDLVASICGVKM